MALRLVIEDYEGSTTIVPLAESQVTIGRKDGNTIQLTEKNVSREHARLSLVDDRWLLEDLGSYNGVKVNAVPIEAKVELSEGDLITIADYRLVLAENAERAAALLAPHRAANDADPNGQYSGPSAAVQPSSELPQITPQVGYGPDAMVAGAEPGEEKTSKAAILLVLVAAIVLGGVVWFALNRDKAEDTGKQQAARTTAGAGDEAAENGEQAAADTDGEANPVAVDTDTDAPSDEAGEAEAGEGVEAGEEGEEGEGEEAGPGVETDTTGGEPADGDPVDPVEPDPVEPDPVEPDPVEPDPTPVTKKKKKKKKATPPPQPQGDPDALLADARKASMGGNAAKAYKLAKQAHGINGSSEALQLMGVSACKMGDESKAKSAYNKLSGSKKKSLKSLCATKDIVL